MHTPYFTKSDGSIRHKTGIFAMLNRRCYRIQSDGHRYALEMKWGGAAGIENPHPGRKDLTPHIFRHTIARFLKSKGFSAEWIQNFLGHQSYKTTMDMYGTISIDEMQEIARRKLGE